jgi:polar amino acid transport system substrate-binding protein
MTASALRHRPRRAVTRLATVAALACVAGCAAGASGPATDDTSSRDSAVAYVPALHDRLPADIRARGTIRVANEASYPPASSFGPDGRTVLGFEPDLLAELGQVLGVRFTYVITDFGSMLGGLDGRRYDVIVSAMTDTAPREKQADFISYFSAGTSILARRGNPLGISELRDLCGKTVAVQRDTVQQDFVGRLQPSCGGRPIRVQAPSTFAEVMLQLRTGRADAVLLDYPPAAHAVADPKTRAFYQLVSTTQYEPGPWGIGVAKSQGELRDVLAEAMNRLIRGCEYRQVLSRWGVTDGAVPTAQVNAASNTMPPPN